MTGAWNETQTASTGKFSNQVYSRRERRARSSARLGAIVGMMGEKECEAMAELVAAVGRVLATPEG